MKSYIANPDTNRFHAVISPERLSQMVEESADIQQLEELHSALFELRWRRSEQKHLETSVEQMRNLIELQGWHPLRGNVTPSRIRNALARLWKKWAL